MSRHWIFALWRPVVCLAVSVWIGPARADVAIVLNRSSATVDFATESPQGDRRSHRLAAGDLEPVAFHGEAVIVFRAGREWVGRRLQPNRMYFFADAVEGSIQLCRLGLSGDAAEVDVLPAGLPFDPQNPEATGADRPALSATSVGATGERAAGNGSPGNGAPVDGAPSAGAPAGGSKLDSRVTIPVKILVDDNDPATRPVWEKRIRRRVEAANEILGRVCFVELRIVAVDEWRSQEGAKSFDDTLAEFERAVSPAPARLAIGFTSQHKIPRGVSHLGGTRALLHSHILMREWSQVASESERLEILLHELGHFLGAAHVPEPESVMRTMLADRKSRATSFRIRFDPLNALAMNLVSAELRRDINLRPADISLPAQFELCKVYEDLERAMPADPAASQMETILETAGLTPKLAAAEWVLRSVLDSAEANAGRPSAGVRGGGRLEGDALAEFYVAQAAAAARKAPRKLAASGFTLGMAVALDRANLLGSHPLVKPVYDRLEPPSARERRLRYLGEPTALGRVDLAQHFFVSAGMAILVGPLAAESIGLYKETHDAQAGTGFSLVDYQADLAGIAMAEALLTSKRALPDAQHPFRWSDFLPAGGDLPEGLGAAAFAERYGGLLDRRFLSERQFIRRRIEQLPAYAAAAAEPEPER